jgi:hypothetical protein
MPSFHSPVKEIKGLNIMAQGKNIGKFTTYSAQERGRFDRAPKPEQRKGGSVVVDEDDEDQFDIPARFVQKWSK